MDRLLTMDKQQFVERMQQEVRRVLEEVAEAVNKAPTGNVISGSEERVRDLMAELRQKAFQTAVQMRIDTTEGSFSPSDRCVGPAQAEQGTQRAREQQSQRVDGMAADALVRRGRRQRQPHRPAGG